MYIPKQFSETDLALIQSLIEANPLSTIVTQTHEGQGLHLNANHIPMHVVRRLNAHSAAMPGCVLRGHVARANPILKDFSTGANALVVFLGVQAYISPSLYASKKIDGKVVPTWNYEAVHIHGNVTLIEDGEGLRELMEGLTSAQEKNLLHPWAMADAPDDYTARLMRAIVGIEITISKIEAKRKLSQNQPPENKASMVTGLGLTEMGLAVKKVNGL
jgi:transcriptional regulator